MINPSSQESGRKPTYWNDRPIAGLLKILQERMSENPNREPAKLIDASYSYLDTLVAKQRHVIKGKRGAGKSTLLRHLKQLSESERIAVLEINGGIIKSITQTGVIIALLINTFEQMKKKLKWFFPTNSVFIGKLTNELIKLEQLKDRPETASTGESWFVESDDESAISAPVPQSSIGVGVKTRIKRGSTLEIQGQKTREEVINDRIGNYRALMKRWLELIREDHVFILVDDFYKIDFDHQPKVIDYLNRLVSGNNYWLKIATNPYRTNLFFRSNGKEAGLEGGQDTVEINLDHGLVNFSDAKEFLSTMLQDFCSELNWPVNAEETLFACEPSHPLDLLIEVSDGNPRSFMNLLRITLDIKKRNVVGSLISTEDVRQAACEFFRQERSREHINDKMILVLNSAIDICRTNQDIGFLVNSSGISDFSYVHSIFNELLDYNLLCLYSRAYPVPDGIAVLYLLPVGVYSDFLPDQSLLRRLTVDKPFPTISLRDIARKLEKPDYGSDNLTG